MEKKLSHFLIIYLLILLLANVVFGTSQPKSGPNKGLVPKRHFVLVHGAGHGAWCWYKVTALLQSDGHNVTALDLPAAGINPRQIGDIQFSSVLDYNQPLIDFMASLQAKERVILVGHSLGGLGLSVVMERFPEKIAAAVFATALMPGPSLSYLTIANEATQRLGNPMDLEYIFGQGSNNPPTALKLGPNFMASKVYQLSPREDLALALSLVRPFPIFNNEVLVTKETRFTKGKYGSVCRVFIICDQDLTIEESLQRWMIERNQPNEVKVINRTDHMVMFTRPLKLFSYLGEIAEKYY